MMLDVKSVGEKLYLCVRCVRKTCTADEADRNLTPEEQLEFCCVLAETGCSDREINAEDSHTGTAAKRCFRAFTDPLMKCCISPIGHLS